jgi:uncharacterized protein (DUF362 family)
MNHPSYHVNAIHSDHRANDEEVYFALQRATESLSNSWSQLKAARRIWIKINQDWAGEPRMFAGQHQELVGEKVARATLRLLREHTSAELFCADVSFYQVYENASPGSTTRVAHLLREFGVDYIDTNLPPTVAFPVPGGGQMFDHYFLPQRLAEADAFVSVQKMKNHGFMGVTLSLKNLFGMMPTEPHGRPRHYYHHLVRMPYMLVDIGRIFNPALNIIDALTSQAGREWRSDAPRVTNTLIAGDHCIATDACGAYLMGHDPQADWLTPPFHRDRNPLCIAAESDWGAIDLAKIDFHSEVQAPLGEFFADNIDSRSRVINWRRSTAEQALYYYENRHKFLDRYAGEYILLQRNEVRWHNPSGRLQASRRYLAGEYPEDAIWFKYVDPEETEGEQYAVYEKTLKYIQAMHLTG